ncbi:hypothetical protein HMPREF1532_03187, partial [Bacteroides salyersiae WAL 10018 = DSM 18765 = JCM 12988]
MVNAQFDVKKGINCTVVELK